MNKKVRAMIVAAIAAVSIFAFSSTPAQAGTYTVNQPGCGWAADGGWNGWGGGIYCGAFSASWFQLNSTPQNPVGAPGTYMWLRSARVRDGATMTSLALNYASSQTWSNGEANPRVYLRGCLRHQGANDIWGAGPNGQCVSAALEAPSQPNFAWRSWTFTSLFCGDCGGFEIDAASGAASGFMAVANVQATMTDNTAPGISSQYASHQISQGGWLRGTVEVGATGTDTGGGVKAMQFVPNSDITQAASPTISCNFAAMNPCPASNGWTGSFDTTKVADGTQTGRYTATDAGDLTATTSNFTFKVDNTKPATPSDVDTTTTGTNGWSSTNSFASDWTNTGETTENANESGIDKIVVDVNPTDGSQTNPAPVTIPVGTTVSGISATLNSVSGVTVPAAGAWTLRLQTIDKAGNVSDVGDGSNGSANSDTSIGYDPTPPAAPAGQANGWISRDELAAGYDQEFTYTKDFSSISPVCGFAHAIDEDHDGTAGTSINTPGGGTVRTVRLPGTLTEDTHYVHLRSVSCNGLASQSTDTTEAKVDRTDPVGSIDGVENGKWYQDGKIVHLHATDALSGMAGADPSDVDSTLGAYLSYEINNAGPANNVAPRGDSADIPVTGEGQKEVRFSPVDLAGNRAAAKVKTFGIDATNPSGYINQPDAAKPTLLSASLGDAPSGVSYAIFSVRPTGSSDSDWIQLPTSLSGLDGNVVGNAVAAGTATARFPDTSLSQGSYDLRVQAYDQAGNPLATQRYKDGSIARVSNPMRDKTGVQVKLFKALRECKKSKNGKMKCSFKKCTKKTKGTCYKVLKGKVVLKGGSTTVTSEYNRGAWATGTLTDASGAPLKNTDVTATTVDKVTGTKRTVGTTTTDNNGLYAIRIPAGVNKSVSINYDGSELRQQSTATATMFTKAKLKLKVSKKRARTGQTVTFSGKVTAFDANYPSGGKIVALQFYAGKKWRPAVGVGHTDGKGNFKLKYKFDGKRIKAKIIFRVAAPSEDAWGHVNSVSKPIVVRLNY